MRALLDVLRLLRGVLGFMGHRRAGWVLALVIAGLYIVWHAVSGAYGRGY